MVVIILQGERMLSEGLVSFLISDFITLSNTDIEDHKEYAIRRVSTKSFSKPSLSICGMIFLSCVLSIKWDNNFCFHIMCNTE